MTRTGARVVRGELPVAFRYTPGVGNTAFLEALRDRGVLLGSRCGECEVTVVPARIFCERCFAALTPDAECGPGGELVSWTIARIDIDGEPLSEPQPFGLVRLDGADGVLLHRLLGIDRPERGMRVEAVLRDERVGSILDVEGFAAEGR
jgi:uncharacterized OB-fold protein